MSSLETYIECGNGFRSFLDGLFPGSSVTERVRKGREDVVRCNAVLPRKLISTITITLVVTDLVSTRKPMKKKQNVEIQKEAFSSSNSKALPTHDPSLLGYLPFE